VFRYISIRVYMIRGALSYHGFMEEAFGSRWAMLSKALTRKKRNCTFVNGFAGLDLEEFVAQHRLTSLYGMEDCFEGPVLPDRKRVPESGVLSHFLLDFGSVLAAKALNVTNADRVLDMCAAPGGKAVIFANKEPQLLILNEISRARRSKLYNVLRSYVPKDRRGKIRVQGMDATKFGRFHAREFTKVLLDAPCSSDRHLLKNPEEMRFWSQKRPKKNAKRQVSLLLSGLKTLLPGGQLVYSTCAVLDTENDEVVEEALQRTSNQIPVQNISDRIEFPVGERTRLGWRVFPDNDDCNWGPTFISVLQAGSA